MSSEAFAANSFAGSAGVSSFRGWVIFAGIASAVLGTA